MATLSGLSVYSAAVSIRFIQGYRYLDRCGEILVRIEDELGSPWRPASVPTPQGATVKNPKLALLATFDANGLAVEQQAFSDIREFLDATCRVYDILWKGLEITRVNVPAFACVLQKGLSASGRLPHRA